jgi:hypothetical protein
MKKTTRILTVLVLAASSVLFATPSQAVPTVNIAIDCALPASENDQPVGNGWAIVTTFTNCTGISPNWPFGTTWELKTGSTVVPATTAGVQGTGTNGIMQMTPGWTGLSATSTYVLTINLPDPLPAAYKTGFTASKNTPGSKSGVAGTKTGGVSYFSVHFFTIDPSYVPGGGSTVTTATRIRGNVKATLDSVTFTDDGTGTAGTLTWRGTNIDSVRYLGPATTYPLAFNYGAYTSSWNGALQNLTPNTTYTFDFFANSIDDYPAMKSVTFKTGAAPAVAAEKDAAYWTRFVDTYVIYAWEAANMKSLMAKFNAIETSPYRSFIKVPTSRVSTWSAISLTPKSCKAETSGVVLALNGDTCTISYTVSGASKAPVTLVRDFKFTKFSA